MKGEEKNSERKASGAIQAGNKTLIDMEKKRVAFGLKTTIAPTEDREETQKKRKEKIIGKVIFKKSGNREAKKKTEKIAYR